MPPFWATSPGEPNETFPGATAYTGVPPGAATSTPKWNVRLPSAIRGSQRNPRTGCCRSNGFTGQGYGALRTGATSAPKPKAVDAGIVGPERVGEGAAVHDDGAKVLAVVLEHRLAVPDPRGKPGEAHGTVRGRAPSDGDQVEETAALTGDQPDVGGVRLDGERGRRGDQGRADRVRVQLLDDVLQHGVPKRPVPAVACVRRVHRLDDVAAEKDEPLRSRDDRLIGHEALLVQVRED